MVWSEGESVDPPKPTKFFEKLSANYKASPSRSFSELIIWGVGNLRAERTRGVAKVSFRQAFCPLGSALIICPLGNALIPRLLVFLNLPIEG
jgi:hypothetical protein